jgi:predicted anti-sigma-YlaC factor YlaD
MRCATVRRMLSLQLDGRLGEEAIPHLSDHLSACTSCARAAESLATTWQRIGAAGTAPPAPDDFAKIIATVDLRADRWSGLARLMPARRLVAASLAAGVLVGSTAGLAMGSAAFRQKAPAAPPEITLLAEGLGDLPFGSPVTPVARAFTDGEVQR